MLLKTGNVPIIVLHYKKVQISLFEIMKKPYPSTYPLTLICMKWVHRGPNAIFLVTSFTRINVRKFRIYEFLHFGNRKDMISRFYLKWTKIHKKLLILFQLISGPQDAKIRLKLTISCELVYFKQNYEIICLLE